LGKVPLIRSYIDRTNSYPEWQFYGAYNLNVLPKEATRENIDWDRFLANATKRPFDPERFFRWRCWWEYGNGIAGDLMSHIWDCTNGVMGLGIRRRRSSWVTSTSGKRTGMCLTSGT